MSTDNEERPGGELAEVHYLPATTGPDDAIDGEIVTEEEYARLTSQKARMLARYQGYGRDVVAAPRVVKAVVTHDRTKTAGKAVLRHGSYAIGGVAVVAQRMWAAKTNSVYEQAKRAALAKGDWVGVGEWDDRGELARERRHKRHMDWLNAPVKLAKALAITVAVLFGLLFVLGCVIAVASKDAGQILAPITAVFDLVRWVAVAVTIAWGPFVLVAPWVAVLVFWSIGRKAGAAPSWVAAAATGDDGPNVLVTADGIVTALRHLSIPALKEAFKKGWVPRFELTPTREGTGAFKGYRAIVELPMGCDPGMVANLRPVLARNLNRIEVEVWPSDFGKEKGGKAGYLNLYVADSGVMDKPTPEYPLLHTGIGDVFTGVPIGITQRGDVVLMPINGSNAVFGGQPGQGKSNAVRVAVAGVALDPLAEIRVHVFAMNGDFDAYRPRLSRYEKGVTAEHIESAVEHLHWLYNEVGRREGRLAELGAKKLTRAIAEKYPDMRPLLVGFSECHELFGNSEFGKMAAELAVNVVKRGRKTGVSAVFDTQSSRADAIPSQLVENVGFNGCFSVKTWRSNDGFLGDGSFAAGIRATELRFNVDRGTMVATGASEEMFDIVRTFFIKVDDDAGWDQATEIIERAMAQLDPNTPAEGDWAKPAEVEHRDLLEDVAEVLGSEVVKAADVPPMLRKLAPSWAPYKRLDGTSLRVQLDKRYGFKVPTTGNKFPIDPVTIREALARQSTRDLDE